MKENLHQTISPNNFSPRTFGGLISSSDYNTDYRGKDNTRGSQIAKRIISDRNFDYRCKRNMELNNREKTGGIKNA